MRRICGLRFLATIARPRAVFDDALVITNASAPNQSFDRMKCSIRKLVVNKG